MRIGVITCHAAYNYGAMLQTYALYTYLTAQGYEVEYIDYRPKKLQKQYRIFASWLSLRGCIRNLVLICTQYKDEIRRKERFENFLTKYIRLTARKYETIEDLDGIDEKYDAVICGSDQIWNTNLAINDAAYYLEFVKHAKKIAYAPSFGNCNTVTEQCKEWIKQIEYVSIRESEGQNLLCGFLKKEVPVVVDPVFLLSREQWNKIIGSPLIHGEYIYFYTVGERKRTIEIAKQIAKEIGLPVVVSQTCGFSVPYPSEWKKIYDSGPAEFLNLIKHAKLVIGSSFHVAAFSFILQRPFYTLNPSDSRIRTFLQTFNIIGRGIEPSKWNMENIEVSYNIADCDYEKEKTVTHSKRYIYNALKKTNQ